MGVTYFPNGLDTTTVAATALTATSAVVSGNTETTTLTIGGVAATPATTTALSVQTKEVTFTETAVTGTYTGTVAVPAGATVIDVIWRNTVLWTNGTSASLIVGDDDDDNGYIEATDIKAAPAADTVGARAGFSTKESLGATCGVYKGGGGKYCAAAKTITAKVTTGAGNENAGRSRLLVVYAVPVVSAATKA